MRKLALLLVLTSLIAAGCNTSEELRTNQQKRLKNAKASRFRASGSPSIAISGQIITYEELLKTPILDNEKLVPISEALKPKAQSNDFETFKTNAQMYLRQALDDKIKYILIYEMAKKQAKKESKKDVSDQFDEAIDQQIEKHVKDFVINKYGGDYAKAQQYLESQGSDWESFKEF